MAKKQKAELSSGQRLMLILEVFDVAQKEYDSLETTEIGADLAYLFAAIAANGFCQWPSNQPILKRVLKKLGRKHLVWQYIKIEKPN